MFYFVARGSMLLRDGSDAGGGALMELKAGDAVLMPRGGEHALLSAPGVSCTSLADLDATRICESIARRSTRCTAAGSRRARSATTC